MPQSKPFHAYLEHLAGLDPVVLNSAQPTILGATSDSREVRPGWLFCAIPGSRQDGTEFVAAAVQAGAVAVVAPRPVPVPPHVALVQVRDAYAAAGRVAEVLHDFPSRSMRLFGITGTKGKTTCAFLLRAILTRAGIRTGMIGTVVYDVGSRQIPADRTTPTPFEVQALLAEMRDTGLAAAVIETSSHSLHQHRMGAARFAGALFTNLSGEHLDYHKDMNSYFEAKKLLFTEHLAPDAPAVVNLDNEWGRRLARDLRDTGSASQPVSHGVLATFGVHRNADFRTTYVRTSVTGSAFTLKSASDRLRLPSPLMGRFNVSNIAGVATLALRLGIDPETIAAVVHEFHGAPGRLQRVDTDRKFAVFVDYAHTDDALLNVLSTLRALKPKRLVAVFGCGGNRDRTKRPRMGRVAAELADVVIVTSDNPRDEDPREIIREIEAGIPPGTASHVAVDRREAIRLAVRDARPGDLIVIAGKGHEDYQEIKGEKFPFDDTCEVRTALTELGSPTG
ncbi:MAG: UDP-N-acetylmuramoyl-L-alanyl-D-glutamate--2,6-diaminopimelate ligase [Lentisphaerae bacterium RIFOXYB12_FULL_65_16]|nr:MAG: UDP-N-acetylmuramoyl-L-alanyl-D-glutamate--2,6-diaminopimelate ligase [Lentisphaerae bacterium RIFOXYA12_64_32]OGV84316.1 MAG: UDP-N-acetylmuramoyl-L-alanyl-D-glutamate--2,6-diaminopimelate ligase [Lentisphaerae bacterium RIFOXYB12_FULL_65_16]